MHHSFDINYAREFGIEEAIFIQHFQFWISYNKVRGKNQIDGRTWSYQTQKSMFAHFRYFKNRDKILRVIRSLVKQKVLIKSNFNKNAYERTSWYAFQDEARFLQGVSYDPELKETEEDEKEAPQGEHDPSLDIVQKCTMHCADLHNGKCENAHCIMKDTRDRCSKEEQPPSEVAPSAASGRSKPPDTPQISFSQEARQFENISARDMEEWQNAYPSANIRKELAKMVQWVLSNPKRTKRKWRNFITNWLAKTEDQAERRAVYQATSQGSRRKGTKMHLPEDDEPDDWKPDWLNDRYKNAKVE